MHRLRFLRALIWHLFPWAREAAAWAPWSVHHWRGPRFAGVDRGDLAGWSREVMGLPIPPAPVIVEVPPRHAMSWATERQVFAPPIPPACELVFGYDPASRDQSATDILVAFDGIERTVLDGDALAAFRAGLDREGGPLTLEDARRITEAMARGRR